MDYVSLIITLSFSLILAFLIAHFLGKKRRIGFQRSLFFCIFLSPIVGFLITITSPKQSSGRKSNVKRYIGISIGLLFGLILIVALAEIAKSGLNSVFLNQALISIGFIGFGLYLKEIGEAKI